MKPQIALTPDQMHELQSLGLDCSDASMCWITTKVNDTRLALRPEASRLLDEHLLLKLEYAYTLEDILRKFFMKIDWVPRVNKSMKWQSCRFGKYFYADTPLDAAFAMLKYAIKERPDKIKRL